MKQTCDDRDTSHQYEVIGYRWIAAKPPEPSTVAVLVCLKCVEEHVVSIHSTPGVKVVAS